MALNIIAIILAVSSIGIAVWLRLRIAIAAHHFDRRLRTLYRKHDLDLRRVADRANNFAGGGAPYPGTLAVAALHPGFDFTLGGEYDDLPGEQFDDSPGLTRVPFTKEQLRSIHGYQTASMMHPFTCGVDSAHGALDTTANGLVCEDPECTYTQRWVHTFMADDTWRIATATMSAALAGRRTSA